MIAVIRISGQVEIPEKTKETLFRMRLRKKYTATLFPENEETLKLLQNVRNFVAYGTISKEVLTELIEKRGQVIGKKVDAKEVAEKILKSESTPLEKSGIKPFFRLHPPRGGIDSKIHFPMKKGVLGDNKEKINDLIRRML